jgi:hypothetical protein
MMSTKLTLKGRSFTMAMRDEIYEAIMKGGATTESLLELTGTTKKGLASQMTYLRMMGKCPMKQEDGTFTIVTPEEWAASRESSGTPGKILTPEERVEKARKREQRATNAFTNAEKKKDANPDDRVAELTFVKAEAELEISSILLGQAEEAYRAAGGNEEVEMEAEDELE